MVQAKSKLAELVGQVKCGGKRYILERRGQPMAILINVEEYAQLRAQADAVAGVRSAPLPPALRRRQEVLVARAQRLQERLGDPIAGLAELFSIYTTPL
jgi:PHD/YefM family antitoxin component YafN of YafNO toxin-antitoxin module